MNNELRARVLTASILIPIFLFLLFYLPPMPFKLLTAGLTLMGAWEWTKFMQLKKLIWRFVYLGLMTYVMISMLFVFEPVIFFLSAISWLLIIALIIRYPHTSALSKKMIWLGAMGLIVLIPCWSAINFIRIQNHGIYLLLALFVLIWGADSVAYFVGKKWGRTKLLPAVSPGKSVQGCMGALIFAIFWGLIASQISQLQGYFSLAMTIFAVLTVIFSITGDLFESMLKRQVGLKDSGNILPGHGGVLDRIDSLTAAAPIFALGIIMLM